MELIEVHFDSETGISVNNFDYFICFHVPRKSIKKLSSNIKGIENYGIYFLLNKKDKSLYIGQSDNIYSRLLQHNRKFKENFTEAYGIREHFRGQLLNQQNELLNKYLFQL